MAESDRRFDPDSLIPGTPTAGQPPRPSGVIPSDAYEVEILRTVADGTSTLNSSRQMSRHLPELSSASFPASGPPVLTLAPRDAAILGLYRMIEKLRWHSIDLEALVTTSEASTRVSSHTLKKVYLDWPDAQKESMPAQTALITSTERIIYDSAGFHAELLNETLDRFGKGTILRYLGEVTVPLLLVFWCGHKDQRRGLEAKTGQILAAERHTDHQGRRIILPEYFSRTLRYTLLDGERPDGAESARGNEWILSLSITADVELVELVWSPGTVEGTTIGVEI